MPIKCDTVCWRSSLYLLNNTNSWPGGSVLAAGYNNNNPIAIQNNTNTIRLILQGGMSAAQRLNREFVTAQMSMNMAGGPSSPVVFNTFWSPLRCSGVSFDPITLSNGVTLSPESLLDTLMNQTVQAIRGTGLSNVALNKATSQSSVVVPSGAAVDGNLDNITHTEYESQPWWQVDLGGLQAINSINIWNRPDCCGDRLSAFYVLVSDTPFVSNNLNNLLNQPGVSNYFMPDQAGRPTTLDINRTGRYVRVQLLGTNFLSIAELQVIGQPANPQQDFDALASIWARLNGKCVF
jgi:hypothetical protein